MKKLITCLAMFVSCSVFSQEPVLDSIQVFSTMPNPTLIATMYEYEGFFTELSKVSDKTGIDNVVCVFFYKEDKDAPQKTMVKAYTRKKS